MLNKVEAVLIFKALGDEHRMEILEILKHGKHCACELLDQLQIGQSTLSHHMKILTDCGLVLAQKDGKWMHYQLHPECCELARLYLEPFTASAKRIPSCCR